MRWLTLLVVPCMVAPASAQESEAEKLYRATENKARAAKTLHLVVDSQLEFQTAKDTKKASIKLTADFAQGNKARLSTETDWFGKSFKALVIYDGKMRYGKKENEDKADVRSNNQQLALGLLVRIGMFPEAGFVD